MITATHAAAFALPNENYQYDGGGNRTQNNSTANTYDNNNRITKIGATVITHNNAGSLTQNGTSAYTYNSEQRLTQTVKSGVTTLYKYDAFGRRVTKNSGGVTTFYVWDNENLIAEYNTAGQRTKRYAYIPNRYAALQLEDANGIYHVHTNHLDTPTQLTDSAQKIVWQANYQAFGNTNINQDPDANGIAIIYNQRFPGQYQDTETNLYYNFYRDYDPSTGRYLQSDPIGLDGGINLYGYVGGNPLNWVDAFGLNADGTGCEYQGETCIPKQGLPSAGGGYPIFGQPPESKPDCLAPKPKEPPISPYGSTPEGRPFTNHYGTETGPKRNIPGSVIDSVIKNNPGKDAGGGKTMHYDSGNNVTVVTGDGGVIVSARKGPPRSGQ